MTRTILTAGLAAGLIAGAFCSAFALTLSQSIPMGWQMAIGYLTMLVALSLIFVAVKRRRDTAEGGAIGFWRALGMGLAITAIASILYALCWEIALAGVGGPDVFVDGYADSLRRQGGDAAALAQVETMRASYRDPLFRLPITMTEIAPVGVLVSLVAAAVLRNPRVLPAPRAA